MHTDDVLELIKEVSAEIIVPRWRKLDDHEVIEKNPGDLVTVADRESEQALTKVFKEQVPRCLVVGEEATFEDPGLVDKLPSADLAFVIDPIDGTHNFVEGKPNFAVMVAETRKGVTVRSWIWQPIHEKAYVAELGAGLWRNGERVSVRTAHNEPARGLASVHSRTKNTNPNLAPLQPTVRCTGVDYPKICEGLIDFIVYETIKPWDHLPGTLMVREAGGEARLADGTRYESNKTGDWLIASAWPDLYDIVNACWAEFTKEDRS